MVFVASLFSDRAINGSNQQMFGSKQQDPQGDSGYDAYFIGSFVMMKFARTAALFALAGAVVFGIPNFANAGNNQGGNNQGGNNQDGNSQGGYTRGAPGPVAGAGLPILAVGYGVYWLIKRRRRAK